MYQQKKPRSSKTIWLASIALIAIGVVLTINLAMIRPLAYALLGVGGFGLIWSLSNKKGWEDRDDPNEPKHFN